MAIGPPSMACKAANWQNGNGPGLAIVWAGPIFAHGLYTCKVASKLIYNYITGWMPATKSLKNASTPTPTAILPA